MVEAEPRGTGIAAVCHLRLRRFEMRRITSTCSIGSEVARHSRAMSHRAAFKYQSLHARGHRLPGDLRPSCRCESMGRIALSVETLGNLWQNPVGPRARVFGSRARREERAMRFHRNRRTTKPEARTPLGPEAYRETAPSSLSSTLRNERALSRPRFLESGAVWP